MADWYDFDLTREECALYDVQFKETEGFEMDDMFGVFMLAQIRPIDVEDEYESAHAVELSKYAVREFNERKIQGMVLEFEELLNATYQLVAGFLYRLTFNAKDLANGGKSETFQALVLDVYANSDKPRVSSFRRKPIAGKKKEKWIWQTHLAGCGCLVDCDCDCDSA